jgi:antirestriction protein ArdC
MYVLTNDQITVLAERIKEKQHWEAAASFAETYYGPAATTITVTTESEYNDEGGYYDVIENFEVLDKQGNSLKSDRALLRNDKDVPQEIVAMLNEHGDGDEDEDGELAEMVQDYMNEVAHEQLAAVETTYDLTCLPALRIPTVYIHDEDLPLLQGL